MVHSTRPQRSRQRRPSNRGKRENNGAARNVDSDENNNNSSSSSSRQRRRRRTRSTDPGNDAVPEDDSGDGASGSNNIVGAQLAAGGEMKEPSDDPFDDTAVDSAKEVDANANNVAGTAVGADQTMEAADAAGCINDDEGNVVSDESGSGGDDGAGSQSSAGSDDERSSSGSIVEPTFNPFSELVDDDESSDGEAIDDGDSSVEWIQNRFNLLLDSDFSSSSTEEEEDDDESMPELEDVAPANINEGRGSRRGQRRGGGGGGNNGSNQNRFDALVNSDSSSSSSSGEEDYANLHARGEAQRNNGHAHGGGWAGNSGGGRRGGRRRGNRGGGRGGGTAANNNRRGRDQRGRQLQQTPPANCAICFLEDDQNHQWRRLCTLPCCGSNGKEESSSTRFCAACLLKMAKTRGDSTSRNEYAPWDDERYETPVEQFYGNGDFDGAKRFIECPRCRDILIINIDKNDDSDSDDSSCSCDCSDCRPNREPKDWTNPTNALAIDVQSPTFIERCKFAGKKVGVAKILWKAAFLHHGFLPREALAPASQTTNISRLVSWGILKRVPSKWNKEAVYMMDSSDHADLVELFDVQDIHVTNDYGKEDVLLLELFAGMLCALTTHATREFRFDRAARILNRLAILCLFYKGYLPPFPLATWQFLVVTGLNIFWLALIIQFLCVLVVYAGSFFGVGLTICFILRSISDRKSGLLSRHLSMALVGYLVYRTAVFTCDFPSFLRFGIAVPKHLNSGP